jgi:predicted ArsR family transcriptional regulator
MKALASLTPRQERMLKKLIELFRQSRGPVHYPILAEHLSIRNTTAYEMLKLLEHQGYVAAEYILAGNAGPGRSTVVFAPTDRARAALSGSGGAEKDSAWEGLRKQILARLGQGEPAGQELLEELLSRLPNVEEPLAYCAQALTALLLTIGAEARERLQAQGVVLQQFVAGTRNPLGLLPGLALGLALPGQARRISEKLVEYSERCQLYLAQLDEAKQRALADFVRQVLETLPEVPPMDGDERHLVAH